MKDRKSILVTGSKGFIGSHLVMNLRHSGYQVQEWTGDIRTINTHKEPTDIVFHLAAVADPERFRYNPAECFDINVRGTLSTLEYCKAVGARCIYTSTAGVYAGAGSNPGVQETSIACPNSHYATSKWLGEQLCQLEGEKGNMSSIILRLFNVYGPGQKQPFIIPYLLERLVSNQEIKLKTPNAIRDFVHVSDVVDSLVKSANTSGTGCQIYNIGTGIPTTIVELATLCEETIGMQGNISTASPLSTEHAGVYADAKKANLNLGWAYQTSLEDGLRTVLRYN